MNLRRVILLVCLLSGVVFAFAGLRRAELRSGTPHKWALLIGVNKYEDDSLAELSFADSDARAISAALVERAGFEANHVITMASDDPDPKLRPTRANILHRLSMLADFVKPGDTFLFYFSGHGFGSPDDTFLATMDAQVKDLSLLKLTALPVSTLQEYVKNIHATQRVFILDACREDPKKPGKGGQDTRSAEFSKRIVAMAASGLDNDAGTAVLFACKEGQLSYEYPEGKQGAFTYHLLKALNSPLAVESDGSITPYSLISYVQDQMAAWSLSSGHDQTPDFLTEGRAKIVLAHSTGPNGGNVVVRRLSAVLIVHCDVAGASVAVDGNGVGSAPHEQEIDLSEADTKRVVVRVSAPGRKSAEFDVTLERGKTTTVDAKLESADPEPKPSAPDVNILGKVKKNPKSGADMVWVPEGWFQMGDDDQTDNKPHRVFLSGYWIGKTDVTVSQFKAFCDSAPYAFDWTANKPSWGWIDDHPMVNVTWDNARAYCRWAGGDLPTEAQWEKAARGADGRKYPWVGDWDGSRVQWQAQSTAPVTAHLQGASPYGCMDMAGNVWQWCLDWYGDLAGQSDHDPSGAISRQYSVLRGGSWIRNDPTYFRSAYRLYNVPSTRYIFIGFRVAGPPSL